MVAYGEKTLCPEWRPLQALWFFSQSSELEKIIDEGKNRPQVKINWQKCLFIFLGKFIARNGKCYDSASLSDLQLIFPPCFISGEKISYLGIDSSANFTIVKFKLRSAKISICLLLFSVAHCRRRLFMQHDPPRNSFGPGLPCSLKIGAPSACRWQH